MKKLFLLASFAVLLVACTSGKKDSGKKFFRYNQASGITSLDPAFAKDLANMNADGMLFNGLVQLDSNQKIVPCIASSWDISPDGLEYTFHLRDNVFFYNSEVFTDNKGRKVTAQDFVYSFSRIIDPVTASPGAWIFNNSVDSLKPFTALDEHTFKLTLCKPFPPMLGILTMQYCSVIPKEAIDKYGKSFGRNPVGTGPFQFKTWDENIAILLLKNENYFEKDGETRLPYIDGVKITFVMDKQTEFRKFEQGEIDVILNIDPDVMPNVLTQQGELQDQYKGKFRMKKSPFLNTEYLGFLLDESKIKGSPLQKREVRQAINYGFDRDQMIKYLRFGIGIPATAGMIPEGLVVHKDKGYTYDPKKAAQLLAQAGYPSGKGLPEIKLYTNSTYASIGSYILKQLNDIGFNIQLSVEQPSFLREMMSKGDAPFFRGSWTADYPDPENYLACFYSKNGAPPNYTRFKNDQFDALYDNALLENDPEKRNALYLQMDSIIVQEAPVVPLYYDEAVRFIQNKVQNLPPNSQNLLDLKRVKIIE